MSTLARPRHQRMIAGVCAGIAHRFNLPVWLVRLLFVLFVLPGPHILIYFILWMLLPEEP